MLIIQPTSAGLAIHPHHQDPSHSVEVLGLFTSSKVWIFCFCIVLGLIYFSFRFCHLCNNGIFTNLQIPNSDLMSSSWNMYVYRAYEGAHVNQSTCTAMCAIDYPNQDGANCQFTQYDSNICYLGTLKGEMNVLAATNSADLHLKTCKYPKTICSWHNTT